MDDRRWFVTHPSGTPLNGYGPAGLLTYRKPEWASPKDADNRRRYTDLIELGQRVAWGDYR